MYYNYYYVKSKIVWYILLWNIHYLYLYLHVLCFAVEGNKNVTIRYHADNNIVRRWFKIGLSPTPPPLCPEMSFGLHRVNLAIYSTRSMPRNGHTLQQPVLIEIYASCVPSSLWYKMHVNMRAYFRIHRVI